MRLCRGCQTLMPEDSHGVCDSCKSAKQQRVGGPEDIQSHTISDRVRYAFLYSGFRWKAKVRPMALAQHPFCGRCPAVTEIIDHKVPAGVAIQQVQDSGRCPYDKYAGFYLMSNLWGLCRACHHAKTLEDMAHVGEWPSVLDVYDRAPKKVWTF